jgi:hypothetical protein
VGTRAEERERERETDGEGEMGWDQINLSEQVSRLDCFVWDGYRLFSPKDFFSM